MLTSGPMDHNGGGCMRRQRPSERAKQEGKVRPPPKTVVSASIRYDGRDKNEKCCDGNGDFL